MTSYFDGIVFRMAARCEAAGRPNNEDNYQVDENLADDQWGFTADAQVGLRGKGALMVVCDGMGGTNAGEVASAVAIESIKQSFAANRLTDAVLANPLAYIKTAIVEADAAIKTYAKTHPQTEGMGSTIVLAWLLDKKVYVGWCGDSRCYRYNPKFGLVRLSHDHSYVQELVDAGKLTEELAFDHPNSNIITRSLGDPRGESQPDAKEFDLYNGDVLLLCSDGLCGCLRDSEIEVQIASHLNSMQECRNALWKADEAAGWHDNVTICLAQILTGAKTAVAAPQPLQEPALSHSHQQLLKTNKKLKILLGVVVAFLVVIVGLLCMFYYIGSQSESVVEVPIDTISIPLDTLEKVQVPNLEDTLKKGKGGKPVTPSQNVETSKNEQALSAHQDQPISANQVQKTVSVDSMPVAQEEKIVHEDAPTEVIKVDSVSVTVVKKD